jgi:hypothetical protein
MSRLVFNGKRLDETVLVSFNYASSLAVGETITSAVVTATVYSGTDPYPQGIVEGSASGYITTDSGSALTTEGGGVLLLNTTTPTIPPAINGSVVSQLITGGVVGCIYELACLVTTSLKQQLQLNGYFTVVPDLP